jgi:hypothetical protein
MAHINTIPIESKRGDRDSRSSYVSLLDRRLVAAVICDVPEEDADEHSSSSSLPRLSLLVGRASIDDTFTLSTSGGTATGKCLGLKKCE